MDDLCDCGALLVGLAQPPDRISLQDRFAVFLDHPNEGPHVLLTDDGAGRVAGPDAEGVRAARNLETPAALPRAVVAALPGRVLPPVELLAVDADGVPLWLAELVRAGQEEVCIADEGDAPALPS